jgi:hypothetical protein
MIMIGMGVRKSSVAWLPLMLNHLRWLAEVRERSNSAPYILGVHDEGCLANSSVGQSRLDSRVVVRV